MGVCCSDSARLYDYEPNIVEYEIGKLLRLFVLAQCITFATFYFCLVRRLRIREQEAAEFRVEGKEQHRHRFYGKMGIYH